jgi:hypothetical protein
MDWYCDSEMVTIQFLRSEIRQKIITQGSVAIATDQASPEEARGVEQRFKRLVKFVKKEYRNSIVSWYPADLRVPPTALDIPWGGHKLDPQIWVGPSAERWLKEDLSRRIRQHWSYGAYAFVQVGVEGRDESSNEGPSFGS